MRIEEIIQKLEGEHVKLPSGMRTCDGVICGNTQQECTGILLTCCPSAAIVKKAIEFHCNMIYCHEPTFYHGWDEEGWLKDNEIYKAKKALLDQHEIVIYRDHDRVHNENPDMVFSGIVRKLGWEKYAVSEKFFPSSKYVIPETTLEELAVFVSEKMRIDGIRIIGDPKMKVKNVGITAHFFGGEEDCSSIADIEKNDYDVIIPGEVVDWTIGEYIQDSNALGRKRGLLNVGHFNLEEPGMEMMADWMKDLLGDQVPIIFAQSGNQYSWIPSRKFE